MNLSQKIPGYLIEKGNIFKLVIFTSLFALIFINIYSPFGITLWFNVSKLELFFYSSLITLTGVLVAVISRIILYKFCKKHGRITVFQFLIWVFVEINFMALFYTLYEKFFLDDPRSFWDAHKVSFINTSLVLLLPYSVIWLYLSWRENNKKLEELTKENGTINLESPEMVVFRDEKGTMRITVKLTELLYLKAADNYVSVYYNHNDQVKKYLLRNNLKNVEGELANFPLVRCHRSYMINFTKVKIIKRVKEGLLIELESPLSNIEIPISKTYKDKVLKEFSSE